MLRSGSRGRPASALALKLRLLALVLALGVAAPALAESLAGSIAFGTSTDLEGTLYFTALDPGETTSGQAAFAGYSQAASSLYTYLYRLENTSTAGTSTAFGNEHNFIDLDLATRIDADGTQITDLGFVSGTGEEPSVIDNTTTPLIIDFQFDAAPNYGIVPVSGESAILVLRSPLAPGSNGGAFITNNTNPPDNFVHILTGVTTPVPEPASGALLLGGVLLLALGRRPR